MNSPETPLDRLNRRMVEATGYTHDTYDRVRHSTHSSLERMQMFGRLVDESGAAEDFEQWAAEKRKSKAGRKPKIPFRAVCILYIMHMDAGDNRFNAIARTLFAQSTPETFAYLGIQPEPGSKRQWYGRYYRAFQRMMDLVAPWDVPKNHILTAEEYQRALDTYSQVNRDRMDIIMNKLIHATVRRLPAEIRATYAGNVAIDATLIEVVGKANPNRDNTHLDRLNGDAMSGRYRRGGNHEGRGGRRDKAGWEMETVVTVPNSPSKPNSFPILTTGLTMHQPGRIKHGPRIALGFHAQEFDQSQRGFLLADRAYNGSKPERFQKHVMRMRFRTVYDYKKKNAGKHGQIDDVIFVGGRPHSMYMPEPLVTARDDYEAERIDRATYESRMASRRQYELKDHGRPDSEGRQRFTYPNLSKVLCIDPATKKVVKPVMKKVTFTLAPEDAASMRVIKHLQAFEHKSDEWKQWYGMRSHVESNNQHVKADAETDLGNPEKRRAHGYPYQAFTAAAAFAVSNMRRIVSFLEAEYEREILPKSTQRTRRRTDEHGVPLPHAA